MSLTGDGVGGSTMVLLTVVLRVLVLKHHIALVLLLFQTFIVITHTSLQTLLAVLPIVDRVLFALHWIRPFLPHVLLLGGLGFPSS